MEEVMESIGVEEKCCIVVPLINIELGYSELIAINSLNKLNGVFRIHFIGSLASYSANLEWFQVNLTHFEIGFIEFDSKYFESLTSYSNLLMSSDFYRRFGAYDYLLIFQTDALIIRGDLSKFISLGKAYIGAPWIDKNRHTKKLLIGNGGLSLRRIKDFIEITSLNSIIPSQWWFNFPKQIFLRWFVVGALYPFFYVLDLVSKIFGRSLFFDTCRLLSKAEDVSFAKWLVQDNKYKPTLEEAVDFSFESNPQRCYEINKQRLPFGCHAWERYDLQFWETHLSELNIRIK
jgi:hypothetical protein